MAERKVEISVIMGVYNPWNQSILKNAVNSILNQSFQDFEFIIYNDGSHPKTELYIRELKKLDERILLIGKKENHGLAFSLNSCIDIAKGRYIARMDADDISLPDRLKIQYEFLENHPKYAWCGCNTKLFDEQGIWGKRDMPENPKYCNYLKYSPYIHPTVMYRKTIFKDNIRYLETQETLRCEDYEIFMRFYRQGLQGYNIQQYLFCYRENKESFQKRKMKYRINEAKIRYRNFKEMNILFPIGWLYVLRPIIAGFLPNDLIAWIKRREFINKEDIALIKRIHTYENMLRKDTVKLTTLQSYSQFYTKQISIQDQLYLHIFTPTLLFFVEWVLIQAKNSRKQRLYFLARDGYFMYLVAKQICTAKKIHIDLKYLNVSRYSLRAAQYHLLGKKSLDFICIRGICVTFEKIMKRACLTEQEAKQIAELCDYSDKYTKILNYKEIQKLKKLLYNIPLFFQYMNQHSKITYPNTIGYLIQEGLLEEVPYAIVDSGWTGTLQQSLEQLLWSVQSLKKKKIEGYYFGLYEIPKNTDRKYYHGYYFEPHNYIRRKVHFSNCLFEAVYSAPEAMTIGYQKEKNRYIPLKNKQINPNTEIIKIQEQLLKNYLKEYLKKENLEKIFLNTKSSTKIVENILTIFMSTPKEFEVNYFGEYLFCDDVLEGQMQCVAAKLSNEEIHKQRFLNKLLIMLGFRNTEIHESAWIEGSIVRNKTKVISNLYHAVLYKYFIYIRKVLQKR